MLDSDKVITAINGDPLQDAKEFRNAIADDKTGEYKKEYTRS